MKNRKNGFILPASVLQENSDKPIIRDLNAEFKMKGGKVVIKTARNGTNVMLSHSDRQYLLEFKKRLLEELKHAFRPEFLNRVDSIIVFHALSKEQIAQIVDLEIDKVRARLVEHDVNLEVTEAARSLLANEGYDEEYGARPLRRVIQQKVEDELADAVLMGTYAPSDTVVVDAEDEEIVLRRVREEEPAVDLVVA